MAGLHLIPIYRGKSILDDEPRNTVKAVRYINKEELSSMETSWLFFVGKLSFAYCEVWLCNSQPVD